MKTKPEWLTPTDWQLLKEKYPGTLEEIIEKVNMDYPVQYLIGNVDFYDTLIKVNESVLIPRFETEYLVEKTIHKLQEKPNEHWKILELGTGSGCISIALKKHLNCDITAIDNSEEALLVAKENANQNQTEINFLLEDIKKADFSGYDVLISNPPYVSAQEFVDPKIQYEPEQAIFASDNGLYFYKLILSKIAHLKEKPTLVAFEIGMTQGKKIIDYAKTQFKIKEYTLEKDLTGKDRYLFIEPK